MRVRYDDGFFYLFRPWILSRRQSTRTILTYVTFLQQIVSVIDTSFSIFPVHSSRVIKNNPDMREKRTRCLFVLGAEICRIFSEKCNGARFNRITKTSLVRIVFRLLLRLRNNRTTRKSVSVYRLAWADKATAVQPAKYECLLLNAIKSNLIISV